MPSCSSYASMAAVLLSYASVDASTAAQSSSEWALSQPSVPALAR